jgi:tetratricopeptide (TPR) repeat protein
MAEPRYMNENRYTYQVGSWRRPATSAFLLQTPESAFEQNLQDLFLTGQTHLQQGELTLALQSFQEATALILRTVHPTVPLDPVQIGKFRFPLDVTLVDTLVAKTADMLVKTAPAQYAFPLTLVGGQSALPAPAQQLLAPIAGAGLQVTSFHAAVQANVSAGLAAAGAGNWKQAVALYQAALDQTPAAELAIRGGLQHDLAVLNEKAGNAAQAQELSLASADAFGKAALPDAQGEALATAAGIFSRGGNAQKAADLAQQLEKLKSTTNLNAVTTRQVFVAQSVAAAPPAALLPAGAFGAAGTTRTAATPVIAATAAATAPQAFAFDAAAPVLIASSTSPRRCRRRA